MRITGDKAKNTQAGNWQKNQQEATRILSRSKYKNKRVSVDNLVFDSLKEANRYKELCLLVKAGKIENLACQVPYELIPAQYGDVDGKRKCLERACVYYADFLYRDKETGQWVCEDAKGYRTEVFKIKKKLMLQVHGIRIHEV